MIDPLDPRRQQQIVDALALGYVVAMIAVCAGILAVIAFGGPQ